MSKHQLTVFILIFVATTAACAPQGPYVELRDERFTVEVVDEPEEMRLGLMFRESMPADHGMIFVYDSERPQSFWMKNTRIPLDIMYFSADQVLVDLHVDVPPCKTPQCPSYPSKFEAQYVLELNAGKAAELGVKKGDRLELNLNR